MAERSAVWRNKTSLLSSLFKVLLQTSCEGEDELVLTVEKGVLSTQLLQDVHTLAPCSHEEADSRMLLLVSHAAQHGHHKMLIRTGHTYIVVLNYLLDMKCG